MSRDTTYVAIETLKELNTINNGWSVKELINLAAIVFGPFAAVFAAQWLQDRQAKSDRIYNNKFNIFASILGYRHALGYNETFVVAINQISLVFHDSPKVILKLNQFVAEHKKEHPNNDSEQVLKEHLNELFIAMAKELGYDDVDNNNISAYFYPLASVHRYEVGDIYNRTFLDENKNSGFKWKYGQ